MDLVAVRHAVQKPAALLRADGADLVLLGTDPTRARVHLGLVLDGVDCSDCILPPAQLHQIVSDSLARELDAEIEVHLSDPRTDAQGEGEATEGSGRLMIRVPAAERHSGAGAPSFSVDGPLQGLRVGLRHEGSWRSWIFIVELWEEYLRRDGARPVVLQTGERVGSQGTATAGSVDAWTGEVDCGISGLGTCGSCTSWSVHDAVALEGAGKPAVVAACSEFVVHAHNMARHLGHPELKVLELPYPLEAREHNELRQIAAAFYPRFLEALGVTP